MCGEYPSPLYIFGIQNGTKCDGGSHAPGANEPQAILGCWRVVLCVVALSPHGAKRYPTKYVTSAALYSLTYLSLAFSAATLRALADATPCPLKIQDRFARMPLYSEEDKCMYSFGVSLAIDTDQFRKVC